MQLRFFDAGQLRTQLVLEDPVEAPDGQGGFAISWTERAAVWAMVEPSGGRAALYAGRAAVLSTHRIWLRHRDDVKPGQRLRRGVRLYRIDQAEDADGTRRYLIVRATEMFA
jgi:SPP1 family predicted phage head-tail adaptor